MQPFGMLSLALSVLGLVRAKEFDIDRSGENLNPSVSTFNKVACLDPQDPPDLFKASGDYKGLKKFNAEHDGSLCDAEVADSMPAGEASCQILWSKLQSQKGEKLATINELTLDDGDCSMMSYSDCVYYLVSHVEKDGSDLPEFDLSAIPDLVSGYVFPQQQCGGMGYGAVFSTEDDSAELYVLSSSSLEKFPNGFETLPGKLSDGAFGTYVCPAGPGNMGNTVCD